MRRGSFAGGQEPLIVVEESGGLEEEDEEEAERERDGTGEWSEGGEGAGRWPQTPRSDSPHLNPFLLSPYRDMRKRSLPTMQCTTGITASQVRRLSEQGGEGSKGGPSAMEARFLATLSQAPAPQAGGRRHSVVTISRAPATSIMFGRNRRESIAALPGGGGGVVGGVGGGRLPRRDSASSLTGSSFNLQLDIMDDIAEIKAAKKVRLKMWQNENQDKMCEVQPVEGGPSSRYHQGQAGPSRRFSDFGGTPPPIPPRRRASEMPPPSAARRDVATTAPATARGRGVVCTDSDLLSMLSLTSSAQEINLLCKSEGAAKPSPGLDASTSARRSRLKGSRSNSFDVSLASDAAAASGWFARRHTPMADKQQQTSAKACVVTFADDKLRTVLANRDKDKERGNVKEAERKQSLEKVLWDKPSGSVVDPKLIGSAIEEYLKGSETSAGVKNDPGTAAVVQTPVPGTPGRSQKPVTSWFGSSKNKPTEEEGASASCDSSICSTIKDLFIK